jgi:hypothetical protein
MKSLYLHIILVATMALLTLSTQAAFRPGGSKASGKPKGSIFKKAVKSIGFLNSAVSMPTTPVNGRWHGGVQIGYKTPIRQKKTTLYAGAELGVFYQKSLQTATYLKPTLSCNIPIAKKLSIEPVLGVGLLTSYKYNPEFTLQANGTYSTAARLVPQFMGSFGVQPSYQIYTTTKYNCNVYMRYEFAAQTPFSAISSLLPLTMMHLGISISGK